MSDERAIDSRVFEHRGGGASVERRAEGDIVVLRCRRCGAEKSGRPGKRRQLEGEMRFIFDHAGRECKRGSV